MGTQAATAPILAAVILGFFILEALNAEAASPKGGKGGVNIRVKGQDSDAQWLADPEKGWVRTKEDHQLHNGKEENSKRNRVNRKGKGSKKNF